MTENYWCPELKQLVHYCSCHKTGIPVTEKEIYKSLSTIHQALPEEYRSEFAQLAKSLVWKPETLNTVLRWRNNYGYASNTV